MFTVKEARPGDALKGIARMNPADMDVLGLSEGQIIEIVGKKVKTFRAGYIYTFFIHRNSLRETLLQDKFD